jgi:hypothetical protein
LGLRVLGFEGAWVLRELGGSERCRGEEALGCSEKAGSAGRGMKLDHIPVMSRIAQGFGN